MLSYPSWVWDGQLVSLQRQQRQSSALASLAAGWFFDRGALTRHMTATGLARDSAWAAMHSDAIIKLSYVSQAWHGQL